MRAKKKEAEIRENVLKKCTGKTSRKLKAVPFPTPTCQHHKRPEKIVRPTLQYNRALPKRIYYETNASAAETHAG
jgi:hypothetical protein